ncbi:T9SS type A sorting domain-containing protein [Flavobacterium sp. RHBU_24]|uniref:T9SS type A sorting domain-containing protein n=1 Tax=Flavobacterium sp. RHBU_24 TaxID=3391185 RepID=UPI003984E8AA
MEAVLRYALLLGFVTVSAQTVDNFYTPGNSPEIGGPAYVIATPETDLNEDVSGESITWDFTNLSDAGQSETTTQSPTNNQLANFPGTSLVVQTNGNFYGNDNVVNRFFLNSNSITGIKIGNVTLSYNTDNAFLGNFPLNYGYTFTDAVAGTFQGMGYTGTFTGTATTSVDAYGTLTTNLGNAGMGFSNVPVTRLKITQDLVLIYNGVPAGTLTQTMYHYYSGEPFVTYPLVRSIASHLNVPALELDYNADSFEVYNVGLLGTITNTKEKISIAPNPVGDVLHFTNAGTITAVTVTDASGREVLKSNPGNDIATAGLNTGIYLVTLQDASGTSTLKMVKQ